MDKIARIRAEIERQMKFYDEKEMKAWDDSEQGDEDALWYQGHRKMCAKLLTFLDTLSEEPDKSLEEAARHSEILTYPMPEDGDIEKVMKVQEARIFHEIGFIAGAEWQKEQMIDEWLKDRDGCFWDGVNEGKKDTIERAIAWLKEHANEYIVDLTPTYPDAPANIIVGGMCWEHLRKAMEDKK